MLHLVQSNKMEVLCNQLILRVHQYYQGSQGSNVNVLQPVPILVQSPGMAQWLKIRVAETLGIAANFTFPLPSSFIWDLYRQHVPDLPKESAFTKDNMQWKLMQLLPSFFGHEAFNAIEDYLSESSNGPDAGEVDDSRKLFQLAGKIADIYDQYLVYRPDWLLAWENQEPTPDADLLTLNDGSQAWQPILWHALIEQTQQLGESPWHRANLHEQLIAALKQSPPETLPVFVFGISAIPKQQLEILLVLSQSRDVVIFWANPCEHYWGDIISTEQKEKQQLDLFEQAAKGGDTQVLSSLDLYETGNPLLATWGKLGREFQDMLLECENEGVLNQFDCFVPQERSSLLENIQADVLELTAPETQIPFDSYAADKSIQVVSCHSKLREMEVLHDYLLHQLDDERDLDLGDIIVMMPNVADYAPFIDAVFGGAAHDSYLKYAISDRNVIEESPVVKAFMQLLNLHHSRFTLTEVMEVFAVPDVLKQFNVEESELELLHHWLRDAGIRWGLDGHDKQRWELPSQDQNTWVFGLQRLLAGYAMGHSDEVLVATEQGFTPIFPYSDLEGQQVEVLGKFIEFLGQLDAVLQEAMQPAPLKDKANMAENWLAQLFHESEQQSYYRQQILDALARLSEHTTQYSGVVDQDVFAEAVQQQLGSKGVGQRFLAGKINFCTLMPMRSIPFKHVCLLGMNDPGYPRVVAPIGFDLMAMLPTRKGDRSRRWDDRYLFLEAILSARQKLYLSFIGRNERDNTKRMPSILLTELMHYCQKYEAMNEDQLDEENVDEEQLNKDLAKPRKASSILEQPLQPFYQGYFSQASQSKEHENTSVKNQTETRLLQSYNRQWLKVLQASQVAKTVDLRFSDGELEQNESSSQGELSIRELLSCLSNPARYFFENRWHTRFGSPHSANEDNEPLMLDSLSRYLLVKESLHSNINTQQRFSLDGRLPVGNLAVEAVSELDSVTRKIKELTNQHYPGLELGHSSNWLDVHWKDVSQATEINVQGRVDGIYSLGTRNLFIQWRPGKLRAADRLHLWVQWLILLAGDTQASFSESAFIGTDKVFVLPLIDKQAAQEQLRILVEFWQQSKLQPLPFFPESAWAWVTTQNETKTISTYVGSSFSFGSGGGNRAEITDPHFYRACPNLALQFEEFTIYAERIFGTLFQIESEANGDVNTEKGN